MELGLPLKFDDGCVKPFKPRDYMGASIIGEECKRKLWYNFYQPKHMDDPRIQRIFDMGNVIEDYIVQKLKDSGLTVYEKDALGEQFGFVDGKIAGHCDGVVTGLPESSKPHLLEIKSAKNSSFNQFVKNGVQAQSSTYFVQMQVYMHKLNLERGLFVMMNKDNQEMYFERITYCPFEAEAALNNAKDVIASTSEPERAYPSSTFYKCKWCNWRKECWEI